MTSINLLPIAVLFIITAVSLFFLYSRVQDYIYNKKLIKIKEDMMINLYKSKRTLDTLEDL